MSTIQWSLYEEIECHPGHMRKQVSYETCHVALHRYQPGGEGYEEHQHPELQAGIILYGQMAMVFPDGPRHLGPGELYVIPGGVLHGGKGGGQSEALVLNLYLRPHLMVAEEPRISVSDLEGLRNEILKTANAVIRRVDLKAGDSLPPSQDETADEFDILLDGTARYGLDQGARPLTRFDVVRRVGGEHDVISAGPNEGAALVRISIPSHRTGLDTAIDQH
ncbi:MAG: cupin domain-containing protein [Pararhodobacter sp.]|nr:cupin domain-containing protein [Pararhodobacter sp.]